MMFWHFVTCLFALKKGLVLSGATVRSSWICSLGVLSAHFSQCRSLLVVVSELSVQ